jgi:phosphate transport system protein
MPREILDCQMCQVQDEILALDSMVEQAIFKSVEALKNRDQKQAREIVAFDEKINEKRYAIENAIIILMATQQPFAHDLRRMTAMLIVANELERMGDYAKGIARTNLMLGISDVPIPLKEIEKMAELGVKMLHQAITSFIEEDTQQAVAIPKQDSAVDDLFNTAYHMLINSMIANPAIIDQANLIMWVVHNLERFADRVSNICERTIFIKTGELMEFDDTDNEDDESIDEVF